MSDVIIIIIIMILPYALSKFNSELSSAEGTSEGIMSMDTNLDTDRLGYMIEYK